MRRSGCVTSALLVHCGVPFVIDANLDCEAKWSGLALSPAVLARISLYGALVAELGPRDAIELWTPAKVDRLRWRGGGMITFKTGSPAKADLRWADPEAKRANDRRLAREVTPLPGSFVIAPGATFDGEAWPASWVAKAVWSAAGRDRCRGNGPPNAEQKTRLSRLLACGALVVEPWCERILDVGVCASIDATGAVTAQAPHGVIVDARGQFLGIDLSPPALEPAERAQLTSCVARAGELLRGAGHVGPFGVDAFVYADGSDRSLHVCEINARYSFGWIARAYARRTGCTRLGFGSPPQRAQILIEDREDHVTAWIS